MILLFSNLQQAQSRLKPEELVFIRQQLKAIFIRDYNVD